MKLNYILKIVLVIVNLLLILGFLLLEDGSVLTAVCVCVGGVIGLLRMGGTAAWEISPHQSEWRETLLTGCSPESLHTLAYEIFNQRC